MQCKLKLILTKENEGLTHESHKYLHEVFTGTGLLEMLTIFSNFYVRRLCVSMYLLLRDSEVDILRSLVM